MNADIMPPPPPPPVADLVPERDVCRSWSVNRTTLRNWARDRGFPKPVKIGAKLFFRLSELLAYRDAHQGGAVRGEGSNAP
jgi:predicted DNA-binding transcriptional regulator AlpA